MQEMIDQCTTIMAEQVIMPADEARKLMIETAPKLGRWRSR
jgi:Putative zinc ribbon domain